MKYFKLMLVDNKNKSRLKKLLLHSCCAPCSIYVLQKLAVDFDISVFFYDPNIHPRAEYNKRRDEMRDYAKKLGIKFEEGEYDSAHWLIRTKGLEHESEKGRRCSVCFDMRLATTAAKAKLENYDAWATVLTISPHKDSKQINNIGNALAAKFQVPFIDGDWKKNNGFKIASELSRQQGFYRQDYCGCIYSREQRIKIKEAKEAALYEHKII